MTEREQDRPPYWQDDIAIGEAPVERGRSTVRLRLHTSIEHFRNERQEIVALAPGTRERFYVHARPYILIPDITLTVRLYPFATREGAVGRVEGSEWEGMRHVDIGQAQGWCYTADRTIVLWECYLSDWCRQEDPAADEALTTLGIGFERVLLEQLPTAEQIVTPSWEDIYDRPAWKAFLHGQRYQPLNQQDSSRKCERAH